MTGISKHIQVKSYNQHGVNLIRFCYPSVYYCWYRFSVTETLTRKEQSVYFQSSKMSPILQCARCEFTARSYSFLIPVLLALKSTLPLKDSFISPSFDPFVHRQLLIPKLFCISERGKPRNSHGWRDAGETNRTEQGPYDPSSGSRLASSRQRRNRQRPKRCGTDGGGLRHRKKEDASSQQTIKSITKRHIVNSFRGDVRTVSGICFAKHWHLLPHTES